MSSKVKSCELVFEFVILIYPAAKCSLIQLMALLKAALRNPKYIKQKLRYDF